MKRLIKITILLLSIFLSIKVDVYASTYSDKFIISDVIDNIFYAKEKNGVIEYRKAKFKRRVDDGKIVYCIEPFVDMVENTSYKGYDYNYESLLKISKEDWERISLLSYYGYGYPGHEDEKWYPITQLLIWETIDKDANFFYTKTYKGEKIIKFTNEIKEIENLIKNHSIKPSFNNKTFNISINSKTVINDENNVLINYEVIDNDLVKIEGNNLIIETKDKVESITIKLKKKDKIYNVNPIIYVSETYQNVLSIGSYEEIESSLNINIDSGSILINKLDFENKTNIPQGEGMLEGTTYELYDENNLLVDKIIIDENGTGKIDNIKYGDYRLIESESGKGYNLDLKEYYFSLNENNKNISLELYNQIIKNKYKIIKYKGEEKESNIIFHIYNNKNELIKEIETNDNGEAEFELPYGTYLIKQINTTEGFYKVDNFFIEVYEQKNEVIEYHLYDLKVPDTYDKSNIKIYTSLFIISILVLYKTIKNEEIFN